MWRVVAMLAVVLAFLSSSASPSNHVAGHAADDRQRDWDEVMRLYDEGQEVLLQLRKSSNRTLEAKKIRIFKSAALRLERWIGDYEPNAESLVHLRSTYRLGNYWEYACEYANALEAYHRCKRHPLLGTAEFDSKPLAKQLKDRLAEIEGKNIVCNQTGAYVTRRIRGVRSGEAPSRQISIPLVLPDLHEDLLP